MSVKKMILTAGPSITQKEIDYVTDAITNGHGEHWGDYISKFQESFARYIGVKHSLTTSSCTGALHLILRALEITEGDEVIVPDMSWIASASVIRYVGATPVFVDIRKDSWCVDPLSIEKHITSKTRAIIPVHTYGHPADMKSILNIAERYGLVVIEDAAPSLGAEINHRKTGSFGIAAGFSFQGAKMLSTGEGGMITTDDDNLFERIKHFAEHGRSGVGFHISDIGFKYKMSNLQAAWGLAQLERIEELLAKRKLIHLWYSDELEGIDGIQLSKKSTYEEKANHWMTSIVLTKSFKVGRDELIMRLREKGIDSRPFFPQMSSFPMFENAYTPVAEYIGANGVNLPSPHHLTQGQVVYICETIKDILL
jgi:perosamine synthetase